MSENESFRRLPDEKRKRIFSAAVTEFSEMGYNSASMNSVVKEAGISKGSLFQYFDTKLDLFDTIVNYATQLAKQKLRDARESTSDHSIEDRLIHIIRAGFAFIDDHPRLARIYFGLLYKGNVPSGSSRLPRLHEQSISFLHSLLETAAQKGEINGDLELRRVAFLLNGIMQQLLHAYYTENADSGLGLFQGNKADVESWLETTRKLITKGLH